MISKKHKKVCKNIIYIEHLLILAYVVTGCVSLSAFASLVGIPVGIPSAAIGIKICEIIAEGIDLTTCDSYLTILVEVFTNHISFENSYFTDHIESTEHEIMVLNLQISTKIFCSVMTVEIFLIEHFQHHPFWN